MANFPARVNSTRDNVIPFPKPPRRMRSDVPPFDPNDPVHIEVWENFWSVVNARIEREGNQS